MRSAQRNSKEPSSSLLAATGEATVAFALAGAIDLGVTVGVCGAEALDVGEVGSNFGKLFTALLPTGERGLSSPSESSPSYRIQL